MPAPVDATIQAGRMAALLPSLPLETRCPPLPLRRYNGFWLPEAVLTELPAIHARLRPRPSDIFLASFPKSGTTWLKALAFATVHRARHPPSGADHPLRRMNPHECVRFMEMDPELRRDASSLLEEFEELDSPRVLGTHLPYCLLPDSIAGEAAGSRIMYVCRNPKDAFVSGLFFVKKVSSAYGAGAGAGAQSLSLEEAFELFCEGRLFAGPQWKHVLQYWEASMRRPKQVLFLEYERMLRDPKATVKKLAEFMGCGFSKEEEEGGVVDEIVKLCSLKELKNMEVNKSGGNQAGVRNEAYFRKGSSGDWRNHLTPEMAARLDKIVEDALQGSGFAFVDDAIM
ncbi:cytosolic sulfotransferase 5-like [Panicum virgatum]|uniref:Sulfotransferase n=1 Tax=Panicum virgatum TaxID=38727 RepID=A0A8T0P6B7_PANVG|nr:cytosolic sulfotransferase 5-like [Panicum virgatum]KAG2556538.1 hypothetical protein PVAP13_8NG203100 [Panicum virgatum]